MRINRVDYQRFQKTIQKLCLDFGKLPCRQTYFLLVEGVKAAVRDAAGLELLIGHLSQFGDTVMSLFLSTVLERTEFYHQGSV